MKGIFVRNKIYCISRKIFSLFDLQAKIFYNEKHELRYVMEYIDGTSASINLIGKNRTIGLRLARHTHSQELECANGLSLITLMHLLICMDAADRMSK